MLLFKLWLYNIHSNNHGTLFPCQDTFRGVTSDRGRGRGSERSRGGRGGGGGGGIGRGGVGVGSRRQYESRYYDNNRSADSDNWRRRDPDPEPVASEQSLPSEHQAPSDISSSYPSPSYQPPSYPPFPSASFSPTPIGEQTLYVVDIRYTHFHIFVNLSRKQAYLI